MISAYLILSLKALILVSGAARTFSDEEDPFQALPARIENTCAEHLMRLHADGMFWGEGGCGNWDCNCCNHPPTSTTTTTTTTTTSTTTTSTTTTSTTTTSTTTSSTTTTSTTTTSTTTTSSTTTSTTTTTTTTTRTRPPRTIYTTRTETVSIRGETRIIVVTEQVVPCQWECNRCHDIMPCERQYVHECNIRPPAATKVVPCQWTCNHCHDIMPCERQYAHECPQVSRCNICEVNSCTKTAECYKTATVTLKLPCPTYVATTIFI